jgi:hypothetical protein
VLVAITLLAVAGVGLSTLLGQTVDGVHRMHRRDADTREASRTLDRVVLWRRDELAARVGTSRVPCCTLQVAPLAPTLFRVALADTVTGAVLLETSVYHPPGSSGAAGASTP